ncbi:hypothetical protein [Streptomyces sp. NPDC056987]
MLAHHYFTDDDIDAVRLSHPGRLTTYEGDVLVIWPSAGCAD